MHLPLIVNLFLVDFSHARVGQLTRILTNSLLGYFFIHSLIRTLTIPCCTLFNTGPLLDIFENEMRNVNVKKAGRRYSPNIKRLALNLHFSSSKTYESIVRFETILFILLSVRFIFMFNYSN